MDIQGPLPEMLTCNQFVLVMTNRYTKSSRAVPTSKTTPSPIVSLFRDSWLIPHVIPKYVLTDNKTQFISKFLKFLCAFLGLIHLTTSAYHQEAYVQAKRVQQNDSRTASVLRGLTSERVRHERATLVVRV